jgi:hypothetical protein
LFLALTDGIGHTPLFFAFYWSYIPLTCPPNRPRGLGGGWPRWGPCTCCYAVPAGQPTRTWLLAGHVHITQVIYAPFVHHIRSFTVCSRQHWVCHLSGVSPVPLQLIDCKRANSASHQHVQYI